MCRHPRGGGRMRAARAYGVAMRRIDVAALAAASLMLIAAALVGCAPDPSSSGTPSDPTPKSADPLSSPSPLETQKTDGSPSPTPTAETSAKLPTDCRAILSPAVLAELKGVPLNDPAMGPSGVQKDGTLICIWRDPGADTTGLTTKISRMSRGPALTLLNSLAKSQGFTCYTPDGGTRCEKTWPDPQYPVTDGRTLFWRADVLIDTQYSNLSPSGYTSSIVAHVFG